MDQRKTYHKNNHKNSHRKNSKKRKRRHRITREERKIQLMIRMVVTALALLLVLVVVCTVKALSGNQEKEAASQVSDTDVPAAPEATPEVTPEPEPISITVSMAGDCTLGMDEDFNYDTSFNAMYEWKGPEYFLENVKSIFEADDLTVVNLEGPLTESDDEQEKTFAFKGSPSYVKVLTHGSVEAANIANNHSYDYGESGFQDTVTNIENAGIKSFGYDSTALMDVKGAKVGLAGIYVLRDGMEREQQLKDKIAELKSQGAQVIIVSFHWGSEKENYPDDTQKALAHIAIDEGAHLVVGHHPHVLQGIETYNGRKIVYSLGNFCFGGNSNPSDKDTMIYQQTFTVKGEEVVMDENVNIIPCCISSDWDYNDYRPTPVYDDEKARIEGRIAEYSAGF